jgi:hypothetical protein
MNELIRVGPSNVLAAKDCLNAPLSLKQLSLVQAEAD